MGYYWGVRGEGEYPCDIIKYASDEPWWKELWLRISGTEVRVKNFDGDREERWVPADCVYFIEEEDDRPSRWLNTQFFDKEEVIELCNTIKSKLNKLKIKSGYINSSSGIHVYCIHLPDGSVVKVHSSSKYVSLRLHTTVEIEEGIEEVKYVLYFFDRTILDNNPGREVLAIHNLYDGCKMALKLMHRLEFMQNNSEKEKLANKALNEILDTVKNL